MGPPSRKCPRAVDLGRVNGTFFVNVSAGGFIAEASEAVTGPMKTVAGKLAYLIGGARALFSAEPLGMRLLAAAGAPEEAASELVPAAQSAVQMFAVCNAPTAARMRPKLNAKPCPVARALVRNSSGR